MKAFIAATVFGLLIQTSVLAENNAPSPTPHKTQKKLTGCLISEDGKYVLNRNSGKKEIPLTGSPDFGSFAGRAVSLQGTFINSNAFAVEKLETTPGSCGRNAGIEQAANSKPSPYRK